MKNVSVIGRGEYPLRETADMETQTGVDRERWVFVFGIR